jgi:hypothetical protein
MSEVRAPVCRRDTPIKGALTLCANGPTSAYPQMLAVHLLWGGRGGWSRGEPGRQSPHARGRGGLGVANQWQRINGKARASYEPHGRVGKASPDIQGSPPHQTCDGRSKPSTWSKPATFFTVLEPPSVKRRLQHGILWSTRHWRHGLDWCSGCHCARGEVHAAGQ